MLVNRHAIKEHYEQNSRCTMIEEVYSECAVSQPCSMPCVSYTVSSILVHSQPKDVKPKNEEGVN